MLGFFALFLLVPLLSGCWDHVQIEDRAMVLAIALDKVDPETVRKQDDVTHPSESDPLEQEPGIRLTAQIGVPGRLPLGAAEGGPMAEESPVWVVSVIGHTLDSAFSDLQQELADVVFFGHLRTVIVSEVMARDGLEHLQDYMRRNPQIRRTVRLAVAEGEAAKFMHTAPPLERVPALYLTRMLESATRLGKFPKMSLGRFWAYDSALGREPFLSYLRAEKSGNIKLKGLAYFRGEKMVGVTTSRDIDNYMAVMGVPFGGYDFLSQLSDSNQPDYYTYEVTDRWATRDVTIINGRPKATVRIFIEGKLVEAGEELVTQALIETMQKNNERLAKKNITALIKQTQKSQADIFAFGEIVRGKLPDYWNKQVGTVERWRKMYAEMPVDVRVRITFRQIGAKDR